MAVWEARKHRRALRSVAAALCLLSTVAYVLFSRLLGELAASWPYHRLLLAERWPEGFGFAELGALLAALPRPRGLAAGLVLLAFLASCVTIAALLRDRLDRRLPPGPSLLLFGCAAAMLPPQLLALLRFPDGGGWIRSPLLLAVNVVLLFALALLRWLRRDPEPPPPPAPLLRDEGGRGWGLVAALCLGALLLVAAWEGSSRVTGYDALAYHLPLTAWTLDGGRLAVGTLCQTFLPANQGLVARWFMAAGGDRFVFLVPWGAALALLWAFHDLARALGQGRSAALFATASLLTLPWLLDQATVSYADLLATALMLLALRFLLHWWEGERDTRAPLVCTGLALGLSLGTKFSLLPYGAALGLLALGLFVKRDAHRLPPSLRLPRDARGPLTWRAPLSALAALLLPLLLGVGYWLIRNAVLTGNPLFPLSLFGLPGYTTGEIVTVNDTLSSLGWGRLLLPWTEAAIASPLDDGLGPLFAGVVLPALLLWPWLARGDRRRPALPVYLLTLLCLLLFMGLETPVTRYGLFPLALAFLFLGELWQRAGSLALRGLATLGLLAMTLLQIQGSLGGACYAALHIPPAGAGQYFLPAVVDSLPPARILGAAGAQHGFGLLGADHRHRVFTLTHDATPADAVALDADYVLMRPDQEARFLAAEDYALVGESPWQEVRLWRRPGARDRGPGYPLADTAELRKLLPVVKPGLKTP